MVVGVNFSSPLAARFRIFIVRENERAKPLKGRDAHLFQVYFLSTFSTKGESCMTPYMRILNV